MNYNQDPQPDFEFGFKTNTQVVARQEPPRSRPVEFPPGCPSCGHGQQFVSSFVCIDCGNKVEAMS